MTRVHAALIGLVLVLAASTPTPAQPDAIDAMLNRVEVSLVGGDRQAFLALTTSAGEGSLRGFLDRWFVPTTTRATLHERDRVERGSADALRLTVEVLVESGRQGRLATWRLDIDRRQGEWRVVDVATLSVVEGLFRLALDETVQYRARNLVVAAEDVELRLDDGLVFLANVPSGATAAVLLGKGEMTFSPSPEAEQRQIALLTGAPALRQSFDVAMIRLNPADQATRLSPDQLSAVPVDRKQLLRAQDVFAEEISKSFGVDLADLSRETWSLIPSIGNLLAEVRTRKYGTLTYAHDGGDHEDISLFDRARRRNLSIYSSKTKLATRGPFFDEDASAEIDVLDYNVDSTFTPDRFWLDGRTRLRVRVRAFALSALTLRLADRLVVRSVSSNLHGRLLYVRVRNQNSLVVNLPEPLNRNDELTLTVTYGGRHEPQGLDRENLDVEAQVQSNEVAFAEPEPHFLYSSRSYWYAQAPQSDYASATIRFTVPAAFGAVCSGEPATGSPVTLRGATDQAPRRLFVFVATTPVRYLSCVVSRFSAVDTRDLIVGETTVPLRMTSTTRQRTRGREVLAKTSDIMGFYGSLLGEVPYPSLTLAVLESQIPGGHAPGYVAIINQPLPTSPFQWRDDPASFDDFPDFFIAHELAHQWWGQAVGWQNYHEQWLSEGFAQYFAALYAERSRGPEAFGSIVRQLARWTLAESDQGPVYLGYRLGHLRGEGRVFRALVYNKGGIVLHMLRRMMGDEAFFAGVRRFYREYKFRKAGTEDFRRALEAETGRSLESFFARWIYGQDTPAAVVTWQVVDGGRAVTIDVQQAEAAFEFPVTVTRAYKDGTEESETVTIGAARTTLERPLKGPLRGVAVNADKLTPLRVKQ